MVYVQSITREQPTCRNPNPPVEDRLPPVDGCECLPPYILDDHDENAKQCVLPENCGCLLDESPGYIPVCMFPVSNHVRTTSL